MSTTNWDRSKTKNCTARMAGSTFKQSVDHRYNIRGWLTKINEADVSKRYYSAPFTYIRQELEVAYTEAMVWIYHKHKLIAQHLRDPMVGRYSTIPEHLPSHYKAYLDRSPQLIISLTLLFISRKSRA